MPRLLLLVCLLLIWADRTHAQGRDLFAETRARMVSEHIAAEGVTNARVLESMRTVPPAATAVEYTVESPSPVPCAWSVV